MMKVKDVVCGMWFDPEMATAKIEYQGKTYYFCATECLNVFKEDPEKYVSSPTGEHGSHAHKGHRSENSHGGCCCH